MGLETTASLSTIAGLHAAWPLSTDPFSECDNHLANIKLAVTRSFTGASSEMSANATELNYLISATGAIQDQLSSMVAARVAMSAGINTNIQTLSATLNAAKLDVSSTAMVAVDWTNAQKYISSATPSGAANGDIWFKLGT